MPRTSPVYLLIGITLAAVLLCALWSLHSGSRLASLPAQTRVLLDVRVRTAEAHIYLEELLSGDGDETATKIIGHLDAATHQLAVLAGDRLASEVSPLRGAQERRLLQQARHDLASLTDLTRLRLRRSTHSAAGSILDRRFDRAFDAFMTSSRQLETRLHDNTAAALRTFVLTQGLLSVLVIGSFAWLVHLLRRRDAREADTRRDMEAAHAELMQSRALMQEANARQEALLALSRQLQSAIGAEQFSQMLLTAIGERQQAVAGVIWLCRQEEGLRAVASWCTDTLTTHLPDIAWGEGIVGQVAQSGVAARHSQPPGYLHLQSGSLRARPSHALVLPVRYRDITVAVIELAYLQPPDEKAQEFLEAVIASVAVRYYMFSLRDRSTPRADAAAPAPRP